MNASEEDIKRFMRGQIEAGVKLSDVQKLVNEQFGTAYTFMDIRILASELDDIDWSAGDPKPKTEPEKESGDSADGGNNSQQTQEKGNGKTVVEISKLARPGIALSGSVKFSGGNTAEWYVDQYGRVGFENVNGGKPSEKDMQEFQAELQKMF